MSITHFYDVPATGAVGQPVNLALQVFNPGGDVWRFDHLVVHVDDDRHVVTVSCFMKTTPTFNSTFYGGSGLDGGVERGMTFTPGAAGTYTVLAHQPLEPDRPASGTVVVSP